MNNTNNNMMEKTTTKTTSTTMIKGVKNSDSSSSSNRYTSSWIGFVFGLLSILVLITTCYVIMIMSYNDRQLLLMLLFKSSSSLSSSLLSSLSMNHHENNKNRNKYHHNHNGTTATTTRTTTSMMVMANTEVIDITATGLMSTRISAEDAATSTTTASDNHQNNKQCRIYIAPSSVKGLNGYGIYTTELIKNGESILNAPDGPNIPIIDYLYQPKHYQNTTITIKTLIDIDNNNNDNMSNNNNDINIVNNLIIAHEQWMTVWDNYWWGRSVSDVLLQQESTGSIIDYQIMFGSLPNHHCLLHSLEHRWANNNFYIDSYNSNNDSSNNMMYQNHPGSGSFSYYSGRDFFVTREMLPGDEIFLNYGYCNNDIADSYPDWTEYIPKHYHFMILSKIIRRIHRFIYKLQINKYNLQSEHVWMNEEIYSDLLKKAKVEVRARLGEAIDNLLPQTYADYLYIVQYIPAGAWDDIDDIITIGRVLAKYIGTNIRSVDWIKENGLCLENIIPKPSTILYAGRGAFAQYMIHKDHVIVPVPMLQIVNKNVLGLYDNDDVQYSTQLLQNYCFGHSNSTLLLCPNTNAILINHCSKRTSFSDCNNGTGPNAIYRWATSWDKDTSKWLQMPLSEMIHQDGRGLSMEIIATRDIQPGEEIFIDYGQEWEDSWIQHQEKWYGNIENQKERYSIHELNKQNDGPLTVLVSGNLREDLEDDIIRTMCAYWPTIDDHDDVYQEQNDEWYEWDDEKILSEYASDAEEYTYDFNNHGEHMYWPCSILKSEDEYGDYYTVRIYQQILTTKGKTGDIMPWHTNDMPRFLTGYPRGSIRYMHHPYQSDIHDQNAFRRHIEIRDDIFPDIWKNAK